MRYIDNYGVGANRSTLRGNLRVCLFELETGLLSAKAPRERFPQALCYAPECGGGQLYFSAVAQAGDARELGERDAGRVRFRLQSAHADHPFAAAEGIRVYRTVLSRDRSAARHASPGAGAVPVASELE